MLSPETSVTTPAAPLTMPKFRHLRSVPAVPLLLPLISATLVLAVLSIFGFVEQRQLEQRALELALAPVEQTERTIAAHIDRELTSTEQSLQRYRDSLSEALAGLDPQLGALYLQRFEQLTKRAADGAIRPRPERFRVDRDASIFAPTVASLDAGARARHARAKEVTEWFGRGTGERVLVDTWWMSPEGALVLHSATLANYYSFAIAADYDYRPTTWYTLTQPENNPQGLPRWTALVFDEAPAAWMISVVMPVSVNGGYQGAVGHDILLKRLLQDTAALQPVAGAGFVLLDRANQLIASDLFSSQLMQPDAIRALTAVADADWQRAVSAAKTQLAAGNSGQARLLLDNHLVLATTVGSEPWLLINRVPLAPFQKPVQAAFARLHWIALGALVAEVLLTLVVLWWNRRRVLDYHRETQQLHQELQQISFAVSNKLLAPIADSDRLIALLRATTAPGHEISNLLDRLSGNAQAALALTETLQAYLRVSAQEPENGNVALSTIMTEVGQRLATRHDLPRLRWQLGELPELVSDDKLLVELFCQLLQRCLSSQPTDEPVEVRVGARAIGAGWDIRLLCNGKHPQAHNVMTALADPASAEDINIALIRQILHRHSGHCTAELTDSNDLLLRVWLPKRPGQYS